MPDPTDIEALRTAVHELGVEANKGIFTRLEGVLLRLVDLVEAGHRPKVDANGLWRCSYGRLHQASEGCCTCEPEEPDAPPSTERRGQKRDGGQ